MFVCIYMCVGIVCICTCMYEYMFISVYVCMYHIPSRERI